jgi:hypothetical protein
MSATWNATGNARRMLRWTTLAGLLAATVALGATPAAADNDWNHRHRHHHGNNWGNYGGGYGYGYYQPRPRYYYYQPAPTYYYAPPPAYYYPPPPPRYYEPSFSFGLTVPIR